MSKEQGFIKIYRDITKHWIWQDPQRFQWWIDIILMANFKEARMLQGTKLVSIKRGTFHTSEVKLSERWGVARRTVSNFLKLLQSDNMIRCEKSKNGTTIEVLNYKEYQDIFSQKCTTDVATDDTTSDTTNVAVDDTQYKKEKNDKKDKNEKNNKYIVEILDYMNAVCGTKYKASTPKTKTLIGARLNEKFTVEDFKKVIATKYQEWGKDEKMKKYLRPETLFGTKFEGYLNQAVNILAVNSNEEEPDPF